MQWPSTSSFSMTGRSPTRSASLLFLVSRSLRKVSKVLELTTSSNLFQVSSLLSLLESSPSSSLSHCDLSGNTKELTTDPYWSELSSSDSFSFSFSLNSLSSRSSLSFSVSSLFSSSLPPLQTRSLSSFHFRPHRQPRLDDQTPGRGLCDHFYQLRRRSSSSHLSRLPLTVQFLADLDADERVSRFL